MRDDLPSGTVTFLFTDVEGSTTLLHELGAEAYAEALAEHRRVIREACAAEGGVEVDTQGDAFFFAFPTAPGALAAAEAMTDALAMGPIQVRIGLHTGMPMLAEEGYVGDDVHFAARVASSGHGGQVVLSKATAELVELELTDLGEHRLKDIAEPVPIFQLGAGSFPPLKTISNTNLPRPASSFLGREAELGEVIARIEGGARLVTLTGPGGTGKTRLAIEAAATLVPAFKAGVFWVGLATLRDPALVTETIVQTLGAKDGIAEHIGEREMLLLLDNLEQVIEVAPELSELLTSCPNLTLLVTSRELLRVQGEVEYPVPPLAQSEAVSLFCARSGLDADDAVAELCRRLDDLPLAVELAAARTSVLTPAQILERLSQRLDLLKGGRDTDPRQQTLRETIEWSYDLLGPEEQQLFARMSVFAGCTLEAAEEVANAELDTLQSLVEKSLLRFTTGRYWMLETIREFATQRLEPSPEARAIRQAHADYVVRFATLDPEAGSRHDSLDDEQDNVRAALGWLNETGQTEAQLQLVVAMTDYWGVRGQWLEGRRWADAALVQSEGSRSAGRARVLEGAGLLAQSLGDWEAAKTYGEEGLAIFRELGEPKSIGQALVSLGHLAAEVGEFDEAARTYGEAILCAQEADARKLLADALGGLGDVAMRQSDYARATSLIEESLAIYRELGNDLKAGWALYNLAFCLFRTGQEQEAMTAARESFALSSGGVETTTWKFALLGAIAAQRGDYELGAQFLGTVDVLLERSSMQLTGAEAELHRETVMSIRESLEKTVYEAHFAKGAAMSLEDAVDDALTALDDVSR